jgi:DNA replication initiation complex subunit (GINS family)|tara:strand:+ start:5802 stop:6350 length:549 start_codon:yes stop_codon:yes gene_type:complete
MITYKDIDNITRSERYSENLQKLPANFINDAVDYLKEKKEIASKKDADSSEVITKTRKQLENALTLIKGLIRVRKKKILNLVLIASETGISKKDFDDMLDFEKELFDELMKCVEFNDKKVNEFFNGKNKQKIELIIFKEDVGEFINLNGEKIGGFEKGQTANIPKEIAKILIEDGKAEIMKQ